MATADDDTNWGKQSRGHRVGAGDLCVTASFVCQPRSHSFGWTFPTRIKSSRCRWVSVLLQKQPAFTDTRGTKVVIWQVVLSSHYPLHIISGFVSLIYLKMFAFSIIRLLGKVRALSCCGGSLLKLPKLQSKIVSPTCSQSWSSDKACLFWSPPRIWGGLQKSARAAIKR